MTRAVLAAAGALALATALAGCPLPQPLPDYPTGSITPPRILTDPLFIGSSAVVFVPAGCTSPDPEYALTVNVRDSNTIESIEARWFVNYDARSASNSRFVDNETVQPNADSANLTRPLRTYTFKPYLWREAPGSPVTVQEPDPGPFPDSGILRTVEIVVSNGFQAGDQSALPLPNRTPLSGFETQVYRWVFMTVPASTVPCPAAP